MNHILTQFLLAWIPLFVAMDPVGIVPIFLGMTAELPAERITRTVRQAVITAGLVAIGFMFLGQFVFRALGITVADFQVAGGLILLILAGRELVTTAAEAKPVDDFGVVPLGLPLITGPATLAALLLEVDTVGATYALAALVTNLALIFATLTYGNHLKRIIGLTGLKAVSKIVALLLAAIAVHMIRKGWAAA
jgi:multiple antibiotic resistance protein